MQTAFGAPRPNRLKRLLDRPADTLARDPVARSSQRALRLRDERATPPGVTVAIAFIIIVIVVVIIVIVGGALLRLLSRPRASIEFGAILCILRDTRDAGATSIGGLIHARFAAGKSGRMPAL